MRITIKLLYGIALFFAAVGSASAEDSLLSLLKKLKSEPTPRVAYEETRHLKLMTEPWHGSGYLYSLPPELMIREQIKPERVLMGVKGNKAYYFDSAKNERHQQDLGSGDEINSPVTVFKALVNADEALLRSLYQIDFTSSPQDWSLELKPKQKTGLVSKIIVSGQSGQQANKIYILQEDGDTSEFNLQKAYGGGNVNKLYKELLGE
jgi:Outer membrane lipoprotein carrier protein LolA-like